jgi:BASS family bile acid:Na+ symporter
MKTFLDVMVVAVTFVLMVVVGLDLTRADFERVRGRPVLLVAGLAGPVLLLPPLALAVISLFRPAPEVRAGLLLLAACPVGGISNTYSWIARASTALSVTLTALSCLAAVVSIPLLARLFEWILGEPFGYRVPLGLLAGQAALMLVLPVVLGMTIRSRAPELAGRNERRLRAAGFAGLALLIGSVVAHEWSRLGGQLRAAVPPAAAMIALSMLVGWSVGGLVRADRRDRFTLSVEFATRNLAIAAAIAITLLGHVEFALFAAVYFLTEIPFVGAAVLAFRRREARG